MIFHQMASMIDSTDYALEFRVNVAVLEFKSELKKLNKWGGNKNGKIIKMCIFGLGNGFNRGNQS